MGGKRFTVAEDNFLRDHVKSASYAEMAARLSETYGTLRSVESVSDRCTKRLGIKRDSNNGKYTKGRKRRHKIGDEVEANGYIYMKVADAYFEGDATPSGYSFPNWAPKQQVVWEAWSGKKVPAGAFVIFLDGDKSNFEPSNLYCINRKISAQMASNGWFTDDRDVTLTAIRFCELMFALKREGSDNDGGN